MGHGSFATNKPIAAVASVVKPKRALLTRVTRSMSGSDIASAIAT
jgi:hypothetical protein